MIKCINFIAKYRPKFLGQNNEKFKVIAHFFLLIRNYRELVDLENFPCVIFHAGFIFIKPKRLVLFCQTYRTRNYFIFNIE